MRKTNVHWYIVIVRRMYRASGIGYLFHSRYKIIRGCLVPWNCECICGCQRLLFCCQLKWKRKPSRSPLVWGNNHDHSHDKIHCKKKCGEHTKTVAYSTLFQKSVLYATVLVCPPHFFSIIFYSVQNTLCNFLKLLNNCFHFWWINCTKFLLGWWAYISISKYNYIHLETAKHSTALPVAF